MSFELKRKKIKKVASSTHHQRSFQMGSFAEKLSMAGELQIDFYGDTQPIFTNTCLAKQNKGDKPKI